MYFKVNEIGLQYLDIKAEYINKVKELVFGYILYFSITFSLSCMHRYSIYIFLLVQCTDHSTNSCVFHKQLTFLFYINLTKLLYKIGYKTLIILSFTYNVFNIWYGVIHTSSIWLFIFQMVMQSDKFPWDNCLRQNLLVYAQPCGF